MSQNGRVKKGQGPNGGTTRIKQWMLAWFEAHDFKGRSSGFPLIHEFLEWGILNWSELRHRFLPEIYSAPGGEERELTEDEIDAMEGIEYIKAKYEELYYSKNVQD